MKQPTGFISQNVTNQFGFIAAILIVVLQLSLILFSSLYSDDLFNYQLIKSYPNLSAGKMGQFAYNEYLSSLAAGRFTPFSIFWQVFMFWLPKTVLQYKVLILGVNLFAVFFFFYLLLTLEWSKSVPFFLLAYSALIQFQISYHDSFTSLDGMYPLAFATTALAIGSYVVATRFHSIYHWVFSICCATVSLLVTEIGIVSFVIILLLGINHIHSPRKLRYFLLPYLFVLLVYITILFFLRKHGTSYSGTSINIDFLGMWHVVCCQLFAVLPLSNFYQLPEIPRLLLSQFEDPRVVSSVLVFALLIVVWRIRKIENARAPNPNLFSTSVISIVLLVLPAVVLMISVKYQTELKLGYAYLPLYFQNFGAALMLGMLFSKIRTLGFAFKKQWDLLFTFVYFIIVSSTFVLNWTMIKAKNSDHSIPAIQYFESFQSGLLDEAVSGATLVLATDFFYRHPATYQKIILNITGKEFDVVESEFFDNQKIQSHQLVYKINYDKILAQAQLWEWDHALAEFRLNNCIKYPKPQAITPLELRSVQKIFY